MADETMVEAMERTFSQKEFLYWATDYGDIHTRAKLEDHALSELRQVARELQAYIRECAVDEERTPPPPDDAGALAWVEEKREQLARWLREDGF